MSKKSGGHDSRSATTGRFVTDAYARSHLNTTVTEHRGGSGHDARSAITGRYVTDSYARSHPRTTITEDKPRKG